MTTVTPRDTVKAKEFPYLPVGKIEECFTGSRYSVRGRYAGRNKDREDFASSLLYSPCFIQTCSVMRDLGNLGVLLPEALQPSSVDRVGLGIKWNQGGMVQCDMPTAGAKKSIVLYSLYYYSFERKNGLIDSTKTQIPQFGGKGVRRWPSSESYEWERQIWSI
jgi:hypothetical protein